MYIFLFASDMATDSILLERVSVAFKTQNETVLKEIFDNLSFEISEPVTLSEKDYLFVQVCSIPIRFISYFMVLFPPSNNSQPLMQKQINLHCTCTYQTESSNPTHCVASYIHLSCLLFFCVRVSPRDTQNINNHSHKA